MKKEVLVEGMTCDHCRMSVLGAIRALPGVREVVVDLQTGRVTVEHDERGPDAAAIRCAIEAVGFTVR